MIGSDALRRPRNLLTFSPRSTDTIVCLLSTARMRVQIGRDVGQRGPNSGTPYAIRSRSISISSHFSNMYGVPGFGSSALNE